MPYKLLKSHLCGHSSLNISDQNYVPTCLKNLILCCLLYKVRTLLNFQKKEEKNGHVTKFFDYFFTFTKDELKMVPVLL